MWPCRYAYDLTPSDLHWFFWKKYHFWLFFLKIFFFFIIIIFLIQKGVWPYRHAHDCSHLVTMILKIYMGCSWVGPTSTFKQGIHRLFLYICLSVVNQHFQNNNGCLPYIETMQEGRKRMNPYKLFYSESVEFS